MFVFVTDRKGKQSIRPMYIGFIKNNFIRRLLMCLIAPITLLLTLCVNLVIALAKTLLVFVVSLWTAVYSPVSKLKMPYNTELWKRPRTKADKYNRMN